MAAASSKVDQSTQTPYIDSATQRFIFKNIDNVNIANKLIVFLGHKYGNVLNPIPISETPLGGLASFCFTLLPAPNRFTVKLLNYANASSEGNRIGKIFALDHPTDPGRVPGEVLELDFFGQPGFVKVHAVFIERKGEIFCIERNNRKEAFGPATVLMTLSEPVSLKQRPDGQCYSDLFQYALYLQNQNKRISSSNLLKLAFKMIRMANALHEKGTMHRDIKPENLLLTSLGDLVLTDFGFARQVDKGNPGRRYSHSGSPEYVSPEVVNEGDVYNESCDMWSIGASIYTLTFLECPFGHRGDGALLQKIANVPPLPFTFEQLNNLYKRNRNESMDHNLAFLIQSLLVKDPKKRMTAKEAYNHPIFDLFKGQARA